MIAMISLGVQDLGFVDGGVHQLGKVVQEKATGPLKAITLLMICAEQGNYSFAFEYLFFEWVAHHIPQTPKNPRPRAPKP